MRELDTEISNLVQNMFPSFYKEDGENFVMFVKAYYEWLEQNHQIITLENSSNFNVGDTVQQEDVVGTVVSYVGKDLLVHVEGLDTFKCFNVCSELLPITSSSGGSSYILKGGMTKRLGTLFLSRKLLEIRDIDKTLDLFIVRFKEKYLKNIEFDIQTNKQLLVKNSLDLYRSKGTQRSIDLFFRLIYGTSAEVYYPGDDVMRLSDGQWVRPQYIEISGASVDRSISLVGKQITGVTSGATAFVEKYIKRKIKDGFVHILYVSNLSGDFINHELLKSGELYPDSPMVVGSLSSVEVVSGSKLFKVGDIVSFNSTRGDHGLARVSSISDRTGVVDFVLVEGGYGYTESANQSYSANELASRTQSTVSEKVLTLSNVVTSNIVSTISVVAGGSGYNNTDVAVVQSPWTNATGSIVTNANGSILSISIRDSGSGFFANNPLVSITNATGGSTSGTAANLVASTAEPTQYFRYFESVKQGFVNVAYDNATNNQLMLPGEKITIANSTANVATGVIISNSNGALADANGSFVLGVNSTAFGAGAIIKLNANTSVSANVVSSNDTSANSIIMGIPNTATFSIGTLVGTIERGDEVYQVNGIGIETANAAVSTTNISGTTGSIEVVSLRGVFQQDRQLRVRNKSTTCMLSVLTINVGVYKVSNNYSNNYDHSVYLPLAGMTANVIAVSSGSGAAFRVGSVSDTETVYLNTDLLAANNQPATGANQAFMSVRLNANNYGFPKNPSGNSGTIVFSCLNFDQFTIGSIASLSSIDPGSQYNIDPYVLAYQPYISGFDLRDYIIKVGDVTGSFGPGERIEQTAVSLSYYDLDVSVPTGYTVGEKVYQGTVGSETATGIISSITASTNTIRVSDVTGTFQTSTPLKSYISAGLNANTTSVSTATVLSTAKGVVKGSNTTHVFVKRRQFDNRFVIGQTITGGASGASAKIVDVYEDPDTLPMGMNATISGNVVTSNGYVTSLRVIDSGVGYSNGEIMLYTSQDGERSGEAKAVVSGHGVGSGYYKTSKGFLSSLSKIHDGDYYQEYSYEIMSRIPFEKYADMYKKVLHAAGTRFFGSVVLNDVFDTSIGAGNTEVSIANYGTLQFNANSNVIDGRLVVNNQTSNGDLVIKTGDKVKYYTSAGNVSVYPLSNNQTYYAYDANGTSVTLSTNPRALVYANVAGSGVITNRSIAVRNSFVNGDVISYSNNNTSVSGLRPNTNYFVRTSTSGINFTLSESNTDVYTIPTNSSITYTANNSLPGAQSQFAACGTMDPTGTKLYIFGQTSGNNGRRIVQFSLPQAWNTANAVRVANTVNMMNVFAMTVVSGIQFKPDGTKMYLSDAILNEVAEFTLTTPWNVNTAVYTSSANVMPVGNTYTFNPSTDVDIANNTIAIPAANAVFTNNQTVIYRAGAGTSIGGLVSNSAYVVRYANSTTLTLSTSTTASNIDITATGTGTQHSLTFYSRSITDVVFNPTGDRMYISEVNTDAVYQYDLSTPWQVNTAVFNGGVYGNVTSLGDTNLTSIAFTPDGRKMLVIGSSSNRIYGATLYTPWDITSAVRDVNLNCNVASYILSPRGMWIKPDCTKLYLLRNNSTSVAEFDWFNFKTANNSGHTFAISSINIVSNTTANGVSTNGHYLQAINEA